MFFCSLILFSSISCKLRNKKQFNQKVVNGGFENGADGWISNDIEILSANTYNNNWSKDQGSVSELDAWKGNTEISQTIDLYQGTYTLRFKAAAREGVALDSNKLIVSFNGSVVLNYTPADYKVKSFKIVVNSVFGKNTLSFKGDGKSDGVGITIDNISLKAKELEFVVDGTFEKDGEGWSSDDKEVLDGSNYSPNWKSGKVTELDAWRGNTIMKQIFKIDVPATFVLKFDYNARAGVALDSNKFSVSFNGNTILSVSPTDYDNHSIKIYINANAGSNTLEFKGEGKSDTLGMTIDNVSIKSFAPEKIINGGFESGSEGWTSNDIEVGDGKNYSDFFNTKISELDAWKGNTEISQTFDSDDDDDYIVRIDSAARKGVDLESCQAQIYFNGDLIAEIKPSDYKLIKNIYYVKVKEGSNELKIKGTGKQDTLGLIIDNISCRKRPEATGKEYITNGGFENGSTGFFSDDIEIGNGSSYSDNMKSGNVSELDAWKGNTEVVSKPSIEADGYYELKFEAASRKGVSQESNKAKVLIDGVELLNIDNSDYEKHTYFIPRYLSAGEHKVSFRGTGKNDTVGIVIDNISLRRLF